VARPQTIVELSGHRRLVREYDEHGRLVRVRIEPVTLGVTPDLPAVEKRAPPPRSAPQAAPPPAPAEALPLPPPEPAVEPPAPAPPPVAPRPPEPIVEPPRPRRFEVLAVERATPPPPPRVEPAPEPARAPEPPPPPQARSAEDADEPVGIRRAPEPPRVEPPPEPERLPEPEPPRHYEVPDLDARVDAALQRRDRPKAKKRAPLPVPQFEPIQREPWEDRLDAVLSKS
jgi:hypothetical protein